MLRSAAYMLCKLADTSRCVADTSHNAANASHGAANTTNFTDFTQILMILKKVFSALLGAKSTKNGLVFKKSLF